MFRILHLEDDTADAYLIRRHLQATSLDLEITLVQSRDAYQSALAQPWDLVLADNALPTFGSPEALEMLRARQPGTPFVVLSGSDDERRIVESLRSGAADYVLKHQLPQLVVTLHRLLTAAPPSRA